MSFADLSVSAAANAELVAQKVSTDDNNESFTVNNTVLTPSVNVAFDGRKLDVNANASHTRVFRSLNGESLNADFTEYNINTNYQAIDNVLSFSASGTQRYQSSTLSSFNVDDFLLNSENLSKVQSYQAGVNVNLRRNDWFGFSASASYSSNESDVGQNQSLNVDNFKNDRYSSSFSLISGEAIHGVRSSLTGNLNYSKRNNGQDFINQELSLNNDIYLYGDLGLVVNGFYQNLEIRNSELASSSGLQEFYSVGAGFIWQSAEDRYVELAYNTSTTIGTDGLEDESDNFFSYELNWAFSPRTSVSGSLTRRFYGNAGEFSFNHSMRNWRSSIRYQESVNSTSQLISDTETSLFVCQIGSNNISQCSLADPTNFELEDGQILTSLDVQNFDINDRVVLRKGLVAQSGVTRRRTTLSFVASKNEVEELEIDRNFDTSQLQTTVSIQTSRRATLSYSHRFSKVESNQADSLFTQVTNQHTLSYRRNLSQKLSSSLSLSHLNRNGQSNQFSSSFIGLNGSLTDRRITLAISYDFGRD